MVGIGRDYAVHPQLPGNVSELGDVVAAFGKFEGRHECVEGPLERRMTRRRARETRFLRKREVYLCAWACHPDASNRLQKFSRQFARGDHLQECALRVRIR